ncbi:hypothetical protein [Segnochrobactrum spirostomi]|uniref:SGNH/GDSL hydrolase family protein n=1 Tax=Segnochrobactrum spirostomi TaxID=2608987 RepID=A0A6A7Y4W0_9HYPH|nr:hypothetical protein [Segnochrobactrum spirostomi]MQT13228.1 hypothetical protein [Segnochrobactrum spirostomi]
MTTCGRPLAAEGWFVFGDSHTEPFRVAAETGLLTRPCACLAVRGATALGLANPASVTQAAAHYDAALLPARPGLVPVMQLGEVDCGFVIWYRAEKKGVPVSTQFEASLAGYFGFVDHLLKAGYPTLVVTGATVPTIRDGQNWGEVAHLRREVTTSLIDRTRLTLDYNARLAEGAAARGLPFIDIAAAVLCPEAGVVRDEYRRKDPLNHHLHRRRAAALWAAELNALVAEDRAIEGAPLIRVA